MRNDLITLYEFGFVNFDKNFAVLLNFKNVENAAAHLLENSGMN